MFFEDTQGDAYPVSRIVALLRGRKDKGYPYHIAVLDDETEVEVYAYVRDLLVDGPLSVFPALPETYLITEDENEDKDTFSRDEILAWWMANDGGLYPVTHEGVKKKKETWFLLPHGSVVGPEIAKFKSINDYLAHRRKESD